MEDDAQDQVGNNPSLRERLLFQLASLLTQGWVDYGFTVSLDPVDSQAALVCFVNHEAFRRHFHSAWILQKAIEKVCQQQKIEIDTTDQKSWEQLREQRPDLDVAAQELARDADFVLPINEEAHARAEHYMSLLDGERVMKSVVTGVDLLVRQTREDVVEAYRPAAGLGRRDAMHRKRGARNISSRFASAHSNIKRGPRKGSKKRNSKFSYENLRKFVISVNGAETGTDNNGQPLQSKIAELMKYGGADQLREAMRVDFTKEGGQLRTHNHTSYRWSVVRREIIDSLKK